MLCQLSYECIFGADIGNRTLICRVETASNTFIRYPLKLSYGAHTLNQTEITWLQNRYNVIILCRQYGTSTLSWTKIYRSSGDSSTIELYWYIGGEGQIFHCLKVCFITLLWQYPLSLHYWCRKLDSNQCRTGLQPIALPLELLRQYGWEGQIRTDDSWLPKSVRWPSCVTSQ